MQIDDIGYFDMHSRRCEEDHGYAASLSLIISHCYSLQCDELHSSVLSFVSWAPPYT